MRALRLPITAVLVVAAVFLFSQISLAEGCSSCGKSNLLCGPKCFIEVLHRLGIETQLDEAIKLCAYEEKNGTSLSGMQSAAKAKGLQAVAMKIGIEDLLKLKVPSIVHLWDNHFAIIESAGKDGSLIFTDPPAEPVVMDVEKFKKFSSGMAVVISRDISLLPSPKAEGPDLLFNNYGWDFGSRYEGEAVAYEFKCRNVGNTDLVISEVNSSCSCITSGVTPITIPPGGTGTIPVTIDSTGQRGAISKTVQVTSNDPISPFVQLSILGYVKNARLITQPSAVDFGVVRKSQSAAFEVLVPGTDDDPVTVKSVSSDSSQLAVTISPSKDKQRLGTIIALSLRAGLPLGQFKGKIVVNTNHPKNPVMEIPVTASIAGDIVMDKSSVVLSRLKNGGVNEKSLTITTASKVPLTMGKIDCSLKSVDFKLSPTVESKVYILTVGLKSNAPVGPGKGEIRLRTNDPDQPVLKIPVFTLVEN